MFFSSAMAALNKRDEPEDDEEEDVFKQTREIAPAKTYSIETAVRYVYGQGFGVEVKTLTDEEKEANERAQYCRQQLMRLKARRAAQDAGEADTSQVLQREEVEAWLADIEIRLMQHSKRLGIPAAQMPIWIAREKRKFGNIASAAKAAALAIRLKLGNSEDSSSKATTQDDQSLESLTNLMEELEELSLTAEESETSTSRKERKRTVRFTTPKSTPFPTPRLAPSPTPQLTPTPTPRLTPTSTPRLTPSPTPRLTPSPTSRSSSLESINVAIRAGRLKSHPAPEFKIQPPKEDTPTENKQQRLKGKKTKTSALVVAATTRQTARSVQSAANSPVVSVDQRTVQKKRSIKNFVPRRSSTENV